MSDLRDSAPHFLRVVRALAKVKGPLPFMAVVTVMAGVHCSSTTGNGSTSLPSCQSNSDCSGGTTCENNACICTGFCGMGGGAGACTQDSDCGVGLKCDTVDGECYTPGGGGGAGGASTGGSGGAGTGGKAGTGGGASGGNGGASGKAGAGGA